MDLVTLLEKSLTAALKNDRTVYSIAKDAGLKPELLYRFIRGDRSLRLASAGSAAKLAKALNLVLVPSSEVPSSEVLPMNDFTIGQTYSREQISGVLGGSHQSYLPTVNRRVVCGCFWRIPELNPDAPEKVLYGSGPIVQQNARFVSRQSGPIPVFLCQDHGKWEYVGRYRCTGLRNDSAEIEREMHANPARGPIAGVLFFERVGD
jgi:hypothetical protein